MTRVAKVAIALLAVLGSARADEAATSAREPYQPYQLVRSLQSLQDQIARGNLEAHNAQPALLKRLGEQFRNADPNVWNDPRNSRAAVVFLLSGGDPQIVAVLRSRKLLSVDEAILDGAIAYVEGRSEEAKARLGGVKSRALPATLGAEITLARSALLAQSDLKATVERLDEVRLLMPGTLIEEAALRREIFLVGQIDDFDKFESLATQYFRRYRHSIYAGNFRQRFALSVARFSFVQQADRFPRLVGVLDHLDRGSQRALYFLITRTALVRGKTEMASLAAERAVSLTDEGTAERTRAYFYRAAARLVSDGHEQALEDLQQLDTGHLSAPDANLLAAALALGRTVRKPLPAASTETDWDDGERTAVRPRIDFSASLGAIDLAEKLLDQSKDQLKERKR